MNKFLMVVCIIFVAVSGCKPKPPINKPGSIVFLDFKNGIGELVLGSPQQRFTDLGFAPDPQNTEWLRSTDYKLEFGDFYLREIQLRFILGKLVRIRGIVTTKNETPVSDPLGIYTSESPLQKIIMGDDKAKAGQTAVSFLETLFGKSEQSNMSRVQTLVDTPNHIDNWFYTWTGQKVRMQLQRVIIDKEEGTPRLEMEDFKTIEFTEKQGQESYEKEREKAEKAEKERMLKQKF